MKNVIEHPKTPKRRVLPKLLGLTAVCAVALIAFCVGRYGGISEARAQQRNQIILPDNNVSKASTSEYNKRVVAYIYNNVPITREELGEYLIARFGAERIELLVNRKILEMACQSRGIAISDADVNAQIQEDVRSLGQGITVADFEKQILKRFNKTMYEWKEDVVRPKLAMTRLAEPLVQVTPEDLQKSFEANYGPKVDCRMIVLQAEDKKKWGDVYSKVRDSEPNFDDYARKQFIPDLASTGGVVPAVHKHFANSEIERQVFKLMPGEISTIIEMPDGTGVILKCVKHVPADTSIRFEDKRAELAKQMKIIKVNQKMQELFMQLRNEARPQVLLNHQVRQQDLENAVQRELNPQMKGSSTGILPVSGTTGIPNVVPASGTGISPEKVDVRNMPQPPPVR